jgi:rmuC domain protein
MDNKYVYITIISVTIIIILSLLGTLIAILFKKKMSKDIQSTYKELPIINEIYELLKEQKNISSEKFKNFDDSINNIKERLALFNEKIKSELKDEINNKLNELSIGISKSLSDNIQASGDNFQKLRLEINSQIEKLITKTNEQVENIKKEIDEHFKSELSKKLDEHFSNVQTKMNDLSNNLVKLETLKDNVNNLSKAFNNTKSIGNFGEILLEDILRDHFGNNNF